MLKSRNPLFNKTISKNHQDIARAQQSDPAKTRRSYFRLSKNHTNLTTIIKDLQKNVKQLKNYHESLHKEKSTKLQKSSSLNQIHKLRCSSKNKIKNYLQVSNKRHFNRVNQKKNNKENECPNPANLIIQSTVSKYLPENGSTMISIHNADVQEVKKAYVHAYGRQNSNIVDLYNFFKKNVEKSTRIYGGSIQMSTFPHGQHSQDLIKSRQHYMRKSTEFLNVIVEDKQQKQAAIQSSRKFQNQSSSIYKISNKKSPTMEEIFKNGSSDLANVYDFVKKRRVSVKSYMNFNKNNQKNNLIIKQKSQQLKMHPNKVQYQQNEILEVQQIKRNKQQHSALGNSPFNKISITQEPQLSHQKYLPSKSSKKSQKSSIKKTNRNEMIDLDENIQTQDINQFNLENQFNQFNLKQNENKHNLDSYHKSGERFGNCQNQKIDMKFKKSKYYVQPVPIKKQSSLDGCSISLRSSSRIIQLDFIPLDL